MHFTGPYWAQTMANGAALSFWTRDGQEQGTIGFYCPKIPQCCCCHEADLLSIHNNKYLPSHPPSCKLLTNQGEGEGKEPGHTKAT